MKRFSSLADMPITNIQSLKAQAKLALSSPMKATKAGLKPFNVRIMDGKLPMAFN